MPNLDGLSATSFIRRNGDRTPIISITSNSAPRDVWDYYEGGMNDCLRKPVIKDELLKVLEVSPNRYFPSDHTPYNHCRPFAEIPQPSQDIGSG